LDLPAMALSQPSRRIILKRKIDKSSFRALPRKGQIPTSRKHSWSQYLCLITWRHAWSSSLQTY